MFTTASVRPSYSSVLQVRFQVFDLFPDAAIAIEHTFTVIVATCENEFFDEETCGMTVNIFHNEYHTVCLSNSYQVIVAKCENEHFDEETCALTLNIFHNEYHTLLKLYLSSNSYRAYLYSY